MTAQEVLDQFVAAFKSNEKPEFQKVLALGEFSQEELTQILLLAANIAVDDKVNS